MKTLGDVLKWYEQNRQVFRLASRLGDLQWSELPWEGKLGRDDQFRLLEGTDLAGMANAILAEFDDIAIFVLFPVFESIVRQAVLDGVRDEVAGLQHPALRQSALRMREEVEEGGFAHNVLALFKQDGLTSEGKIANSLVEEVSRVRKYRNWVAHGRKDKDRPPDMLFRDAFGALKAFLDFLPPVRN